MCVRDFPCNFPESAETGGDVLGTLKCPAHRFLSRLLTPDFTSCGALGPATCLLVPRNQPHASLHVNEAQQSDTHRDADLSRFRLDRRIAGREGRSGIGRIKCNRKRHGYLFLTDRHPLGVRDEKICHRELVLLNTASI